jgi:hypothetical protein
MEQIRSFAIWSGLCETTPHRRPFNSQEPVDDGFYNSALLINEEGLLDRAI